MRQYGIVHPALLEQLAPNFYPARCTIWEPFEVESASGELHNVPQPLFGHVDIPCSVAPRASRELRETQQTYAEATHHIALAGYYPSVTPVMSVKIGGIDYGIEGVEHDSHSQTTRIYARLVR